MRSLLCVHKLCPSLCVCMLSSLLEICRLSSSSCACRLTPAFTVQCRLVLVDAMALLYRGHFGFKDVRLSSSLGEDTSILYGFVGTLLNLLQLSPPPTHLAVVFDAAGKTFR